MDNYQEIFEDYLNTKNLKLTSPRLMVLDAVFEIHEHFTAESLYLYFREKQMQEEVSLPTIYRTLPLLIDCGLVKLAGVASGKESYEHVYGHPRHIHLICNLCGMVIEEEDTQKIYNTITKITQKHHFRIDDYSLSIRGTCDDCRKKGVSHSPGRKS